MYVRLVLCSPWDFGTIFLESCTQPRDVSAYNLLWTKVARHLYHFCATIFCVQQTSTAGPPLGPPYGYLSATGIQAIAFQPIDQSNVVTAYAAFPIFLVSNDVTTRAFGLSWILNMLQAPRGQGMACCRETACAYVRLYACM